MIEASYISGPSIFLHCMRQLMMRFRGTSLLGMRLGASVSCFCGAYVTALFNECQCRDSVGRCCSCCLALDSTAWAHLLAPFPFTGSPIPLLACWSCSSSQQAVACPTLPTATIYILTEYISTRMNHPHTRAFFEFCPHTPC